MPSWLRRELLWLAVLLALGFLALPAAVYWVGAELLGEYRPDGGMGRFYADLYAEVTGGNAWAWALLCGPWLGVTALRLLWRLQRSRPAPEERPDEA